MWSPVADQVEAIIPDSTSSPMRLDLSAVRWAMDVLGIPLRRQLHVWQLVRMLHDIRWHRDRTLGWYCQAHGWDLEGEAFEPTCRRCRVSLGVDDAAAR